MTFAKENFKSPVPDCVRHYYQREMGTKLIYQIKSCVPAHGQLHMLLPFLF